MERDERQEWFRARKLSAARLREVRTLLGTAAPASSSTTVNPQQRTTIGPQPIGTSSNPWAGSVLNLAIDPHNPGTIYAGTYVGKLWKTTNSGGTWLPLSDAGPLVDIQWIATAYESNKRNSLKTDFGEKIESSKNAAGERSQLLGFVPPAATLESQV